MSALSALTLRDHFAGLVMAAWASRFEYDEYRILAGISYEMADAMLEWRAKDCPEPKTAAERDKPKEINEELLDALVDVMFRHVPFSNKAHYANHARAVIAKATGAAP